MLPIQPPPPPLRSTYVQLCKPHHHQFVRSCVVLLPGLICDYTLTCASRHLSTSSSPPPPFNTIATQKCDDVPHLYLIRYYYLCLPFWLNLYLYSRCRLCVVVVFVVSNLYGVPPPPPPTNLRSFVRLCPLDNPQKPPTTTKQN